MIWRHIDTDVNPADIVSRSTDILTLKDQSLWWHGPSFLLQDRALWPDTRKIEITVPEARKEDLDISFL